VRNVTDGKKGASSLAEAPLEDDGARPFLKWAGGKAQLLVQFERLFPARGSYARYLEPFLGGGAVFFHLRPDVAVLADVNVEIVDCYEAVRTCPEEVIRELEQHEYTSDHYYAVRAEVPPSLPARAARTIYLNKTGYNGLYRVNSRGGFNVPIGRYANPGFRSPGLFRTLRACSAALAGATLTSGDFDVMLAGAGKGDFVYLDPPYVPLSPTGFTSYIPGGFGWDDQERLAASCAGLAKRGARFMLSNSDTPAVRKLYAKFRIDKVLATRSINSNGASRGHVREVIVRNYG
jgi:DNA adenine methylase